MYNLEYYKSCADFSLHEANKEGGLIDMIDNAIDITRETFLKHVNRDSLRDVEASLGYEPHPSQGLTMAGDYHVSYHRGKLYGKVAYFFNHSSIEFIFN